jgi:heme exporter protein C
MKSKPKLLSLLDGFTIVTLLIATALVFFYAPVERVMGAVQKVFYFHVAAAWVGMLGFMVAAIAGVLYLVKNKIIFDTAGAAAVEISLVFFFAAIVMGSIWARPTWNTWWTWDPRLTTAAIVELIYAAYVMLRRGLEDPEQRARLSAVYAILGFISVPMTFISIRMLRTIHPVVVGGGGAAGDSSGGFNMVPSMVQTLLFSIAAFSVLFGDLLWHRIRLGKLAHHIEMLRAKLNE